MQGVSPAWVQSILAFEFDLHALISTLFLFPLSHTIIPNATGTAASFVGIKLVGIRSSGRTL